jgi:hypothetical protein
VADKNFKVKTSITSPTPIAITEGGTGQTSANNALNALLPAQTSAANKVLSSDGTSTTWVAQATAYQRGGTASRPASPTAGDLYYNTDYNYFESYTANGWFPIAAAPTVPTSVVATNTPSGRAYNNGRASVAFSIGANGGAPTTLTVTPSPATSPTTFSGSSSPVIVTGLASSTSYTYTVSATSPYGTTAQSSASSGVTATTVPQAPTIGTATGGNAQASVTFTANATGGSAITGYTVTSSGGQTASGATSPIVVTGLTNGTAYTFTAQATNANGTSAASSASNSVTPASQVSVDYLVVAGGGAGGSNVSGGGGGGGLRTGTVLLSPGVAQSITVGGGGARPANDAWTRGGNGGPSSFGSISATGGGGGSGYGDGGAAGGSGGGAGTGGGGGAGNLGGYTPVEGYAGGNGPWSTTSQTGGGGGADGAGGSPTRGPGRLVFGTTYSTGGVGKGYYGSESFDQASGTGNGADGCGQGYIRTGSGGSGIVILKSLITASSSTVTPTNDGSYKVYTFTNTGSITF